LAVQSINVSRVNVSLFVTLDIEGQVEYIAVCPSRKGHQGIFYVQYIFKLSINSIL